MPMRRKEGMTIDEFREYYETKHRMIGEKYLTCLLYTSDAADD